MYKCLAHIILTLYHRLRQMRVHLEFMEAMGCLPYIRNIAQYRYIIPHYLLLVKDLLTLVDLSPYNSQHIPYPNLRAELLSQSLGIFFETT
jgi:hypothetical protein